MSAPQIQGGFSSWDTEVVHPPEADRCIGHHSCCQNISNNIQHMKDLNTGSVQMSFKVKALEYSSSGLLLVYGCISLSGEYVAIKRAQSGTKLRI